jgi:hypothetical protein
MGWKSFAPEVIIELKANLYTKSVTSNMIRFSVEFKERFWREYENGKSPVEIVAGMGYDPHLLGTSRLNGILQHIKDTAISGEDFRDYRRTNMQDDRIEALPPSKALIRMQHELSYLKQEMEFIKKIILADREANRRCSSGKNQTSNSGSSGK